MVPAIPLLVCSLLPLAISLAAPPAHPSYNGGAAETCGEFAAGGLPAPERREIYDGGRIVDITHRFSEDMPVFGSSDGVGKFLWFNQSMRNGSNCNVSVMKFHVHTGTHVDAPGHFYMNYFEGGYDVDTLDLAVLNGPALLVDVPRDMNITAEAMKSLHIPKGVKRVLFRTSNTDRKLMFKKFDSSFCGFTEDGAKWLVENTDIKLIGVDYLSAAAYDDLASAHLVLLQNRDIIIVEGLKLEDVKQGIYSVHCLPLRLPGAEGSPIRCILIDDQF